MTRKRGKANGYMRDLQSGQIREWGCKGCENQRTTEGNPSWLKDQGFQRKVKLMGQEATLSRFGVPFRLGQKTRTWVGTGSKSMRMGMIKRKGQRRGKCLYEEWTKLIQVFSKRAGPQIARQKGAKSGGKGSGPTQSYQGRGGKEVGKGGAVEKEK